MSALLLVFLGALCAVTAAPLSDDSKATVVSYENTNDGSGNYRYSFETSNGLKKSETGNLVNAGQPDEHIEVQGEFSYIDEDGALHLVQYTADQNGYRVVVKPTKPGEPEVVFVQALPPTVVATLLG